MKLAVVTSSLYFHWLSVWIGFVALMAFGNTLQSFVENSFVSTRLYTRQPEKNVTDLMARIFGIWTLLSASVRFACAVDIYNKTLYHLTFFSFFLAFFHFVSEVYLFQTAEITVGVCAPLIVSSLSIALMAVGYLYQRQETEIVTNDTPKLAAKEKFS